jgi:mannose-1-phosphate guanylyltransferase/mannose-6-phosphate isomerase
LNKSKKKITLFPVILCGGFGTRLWPLSRKTFPKQFVKFKNNESLLQLTIKNFQINHDLIKIPEYIFVTNEEHRFILENQIKEIGLKNYKIILEPSSKNTAPSATLASLYINKNYNNSNMLVIPSDHLIENPTKFITLISKGLTQITDSNISLFGIKPNKPNIHFGYIEHDSEKKQFPKPVKRFIEKPNIFRARRLIQKGNVLWNSGIFLLKSQTWIEAISNFNNKIFKHSSVAMENYNVDNFFIRPDKIEFNKCPKDSIDYAVIEKIPLSKFNLQIHKINFSWSDLGNWNSLSNLMKKDKHNNFIAADYYGYKSKNNIVYSSKNLIVTSGISNAVIVEDDDSIFIGARDDENALKQIDNINKLNESDRFKNKNITYRPWGYYEDLSSDKLFKVKKIHVNSKSSLSLQSHEFRSEHWVVVQGVATVICGKDSFGLREGESTYIKKNQRHRLMNKKNKPLVIIEVQYGNKIDENDIIRYQDKYNRV